MLVLVVGFAILIASTSYSYFIQTQRQDVTLEVPTVKQSGYQYGPNVVFETSVSVNRSQTIWGNLTLSCFANYYSYAPYGCNTPNYQFSFTLYIISASFYENWQNQQAAAHTSGGYPPNYVFDSAIDGNFSFSDVQGNQTWIVPFYVDGRILNSTDLYYFLIYDDSSNGQPNAHLQVYVNYARPIGPNIVWDVLTPIASAGLIAAGGLIYERAEPKL
ncbi:MAG: hypothetical protein ACYCQJ_05380 [Nitrososphaerales archaeon]